MSENTPENDSEDTSESDSEDTPESDMEDTPENDREDTPESDREDTPENDMEDTPESDREDTPESDTEDTPESDTEDTPESDTEIKQSKNKKSKLLILVCTVAIAAIVTTMIFAIPFFRERQAELEAETRFNELLDMATASPAPEVVEPEALIEEEDAPEENLTTEPPQEEIVWLTREEKIQALYEAYGIVVPEKDLDFGVLHEVNEHIYAWIYIPNTSVNYPILQHPYDNTFYLNHNLDGSRGYPGCIYTEYFNTKTFLDRMTVIYGHNMRNGTMFADLHNFADAAFFEDNPFIFIYTEDDIFVYRIFSARQHNDNHILFAYLLFIDEVFLDFLNSATDADTVNGNVDDTIDFSVYSRIITLSTCITGRPTERFLVHGVLIEYEGFYRQDS